MRAIDNFAGKQRVREFYAMTKEDAYELLKNIAEINGRVKKLRLIQANEQERNDEEIAEKIDVDFKIRKGNDPISLNEYLVNKSPEMVALFNSLLNQVRIDCPETELYVLPQYIGLRKGKYYFAEIKIQKDRIRVLTLIPNNQYSIGEAVPENFLWALRYRTYISTKKELNELIKIIKESYANR